MAKQEQIAALKRLWNIAHRDSGQCRIVALFLMCCFNSYDYQFPFNELRVVDDAIYADMRLVLDLNTRAEMEMHEHLGISYKEFERLSRDWGFERE